nr:3130_t:CDS:2 [Entrophospora candida]
MKLIIGLGNPGKEFENTRHNLGFVVIDQLANQLKVELNKKKFNGLYFQGTEYILLKPQNYMNNSGECIIEFLKYFRIPLDNLLVIYDDIALVLGKFRYRQQGSDGGHNGIKNIIEKLGSKNFGRLRVGVGYDRNCSLADLLELINGRGIIELASYYSDWEQRKQIQEKCLVVSSIGSKGEIEEHFFNGLPYLYEKLRENPNLREEIRMEYYHWIRTFLDREDEITTEIYSFGGAKKEFVLIHRSAREDDFDWEGRLNLNENLIYRLESFNAHQRFEIKKALNISADYLTDDEKEFYLREQKHLAFLIKQRSETRNKIPGIIEEVIRFET